MKVIYLISIVAAIAVVFIATSFTQGVFTEPKQTADQVPIHSTESAISNHTMPTKDAVDILSVTMNISCLPCMFNIPLSTILFKITPNYDKDREITSLNMKLRPEMHDKYKKIGFTEKSKKTVFVYPVFTQAAYSHHGFYDHYRKTCDTKCLTVNIPTKFHNTYTASGTASLVLNLLNYSHITDIEVDKNPDILKQYDKIIMLHNEYVTKKEFDAITHHPKVIYLYANPLYAEVTINYQNDTITLVKGHGYPTKDIRNAFGWKFDNSQHEYDTNCSDNQFYKVDNGIMWDCYPENTTIYSNMTLLKMIKDY